MLSRSALVLVLNLDHIFVLVLLQLGLRLIRAVLRSANDDWSLVEGQIVALCRFLVDLDNQGSGSPRDGEELCNLVNIQGPHVNALVK